MTKSVLSFVVLLFAVGLAAAVQPGPSAPLDVVRPNALPAPDGRGPVALLVGGRFGRARTLVLDAEGRTLAYGIGAGYVEEFSVCPGGRRVAELVGDTPFGADTVVIRELPTLRLVRQQPLKRYYSEDNSFQCLNASGEQIVVFSGSGPDLERPARLVRITPRSATTIWRGTAWYSSFSKRFAYVQVLRGEDRAGATIVAVDLRTGTAKRLGTVAVYGVYELTPNPAGTRLASDSYADGSGDPRLVVIDLERRPISARTIPMPIDFGDVLWLGNDRFAHVTENKILVFSSRLRLSTRLSGWNSRSTAVLGSKLVGVGRFGKLLQAQLPSGRIRIMRQLPGRPSLIVSASG